MLEDLAAHILDIAHNGVAAGAEKIGITLRRLEGRARVECEIVDDGCGMDARQVQDALDPFHTRYARRVGLGLPFLKQNAELCGGTFRLSSAPGVGTCVFASFDLDHIDTPPLGDVAGAFLVLLIGAPHIHWSFRYEGNKEDNKEDNKDGGNATVFSLDSQDLSQALGDLEALKIPEVAIAFKDFIDGRLFGC